MRLFRGNLILWEENRAKLLAPTYNLEKLKCIGFISIIRYYFTFLKFMNCLVNRICFVEPNLKSPNDWFPYNTVLKTQILKVAIFHVIDKILLHFNLLLKLCRWDLISWVNWPNYWFDLTVFERSRLARNYVIDKVLIYLKQISSAF